MKSIESQQTSVYRLWNLEQRDNLENLEYSEEEKKLWKLSEVKNDTQV